MVQLGHKKSAGVVTAHKPLEDSQKTLRYMQADTDDIYLEKALNSAYVLTNQSLLQLQCALTDDSQKSPLLQRS